MALFDINKKNLYAETGAGNVGLGVMPALQVNTNQFVGKDLIVAGDLYIDKKVICNSEIEAGKGIVNSLSVSSNIANGKNIKLNFNLATLNLIYN